MKPTKWTNEALRAEAAKYSSREDFKKDSPSAYTTAAKRDLLKAITGHMRSKRTAWTKQEVMWLSAGCSTKMEFRTNHIGAHEYARRHGWFAEATAHMHRAETGMGKHLIYRLTFPTGEVYFGLSCSIESRLRYHRRRGTVYEFMLLTGQTTFTLTILEQDLSPDEARTQELWYIAQAVAEALTLINRHPGGGLGAFGRLHLSRESVLARAKKFSSRQQFRDGDRVAYAQAKRMGWFDEACRHMGGQRRSLTTADLLLIARRHKTRGEFQKLDRATYALAFQRGVLDEVCQHMVPARRKHSDADLARVAAQFATRTEFQKGDPGAYDTAWSRGLLDSVCTHMRPAAS